MADKPTLSLDAAEWRSLVATNLVRAHEFTQRNSTITADDAKMMREHLDRMKWLIAGWQNSVAPVPAQPAQAQPQAQAVVAPTNGVEPKRRGGWPKGKPRVRRNPMNQASAVQ